MAFLSLNTADDSSVNYQSGRLYGTNTEQCVLTLKAFTDDMAMLARYKMNGASKISRYPGGGNEFNLSVREREPVFAFKRKPNRGPHGIDGAFTTQSGMSMEGVSSAQELEEQCWFVGVSRSDYSTVPTVRKGSSEPRHGFAVITFGGTTLMCMIKNDIFAGDTLMFVFQTIEEAEKMCQQRSTVGAPVDRIRPYIAPISWSAKNYFMIGVVKLLLRSQNDIGRFGAHLNNKGVFEEDYEGGRARSGATKEVAAARSLKRHAMAVLAKGVQVLAHRGLVEIITPKEKAIRHAKDVLLMSLLNMLSDTKVLTVEGPAGTTTTPTIWGSTRVNETPGPPANLSAQKAYNKYVETIARFNRGGNLRSEGADPTLGRDHPVNVLDEHQYSDNAFLEFGLGRDFAKTRSDLGKAVGKSGALFSHGSEEMDLKAEHIRKTHDQLWLNGILGLTDQGKRECKRITVDVLNGCYGEYAGDRGSIEQYRLGYFLENRSMILAAQTSRFIEESEKNISGSASMLMECVSAASRHLDSRTIGYSLSSAKAGHMEARFDVVIARPP